MRAGLLIGTFCGLTLIAGCGGDEDLAEAIYTARDGGVQARVWIPINEPRSTGTYRAEVTWPDGTKDRTEAERDGMIGGVWLDDLVNDETPELVVVTSSAGSGTYGWAHVYGREKGELVRLHRNTLDDFSGTGYMGHDEFSVEDGGLMRSYPVYLAGDSNAAPSGGVARLRYSFADSSWVRVDYGSGKDTVHRAPGPDGGG